jgi:hypothetical protein
MHHSLPPLTGPYIYLTLSQGTANKIDFIERKILRKIFGPPSPKWCGGLGTMMRSMKCTRMCPFQHIHTFKEINVGWTCKNGTTSYPKEGTRKLFRRKASE